MEMLIVVAIIGVLVSVAIPVLGNQLEKSREAVDLANVRSAYADVLTASMLGQMEETVKVVKLKQGQDNWQSIDPVNIGGITHYKNQGNTDNWKGNPTAGGECKVTYEESVGVCLDWTGGGQTVGPNINFKENIHTKHQLQELLAQNPKNTQFEIDSKSPGSTMVPKVVESLDENSLLKHGTWAYLADTRPNFFCAYLFWTSVDTNKVGTGQTIPVIVSKNDGTFYISETVTATRTNSKGNYVAIAEHMGNANGFKQYTTGTKYNTLEEAYRAYEKLLNSDEKYSEYRDTLPK